MSENIVGVTPEFFILADLYKPFDLAELFKNENSVELEIGAGRGDFAVEYCADHPDVNLIAVERKLNYLKRGINKAKQRDLSNIRFMNVEVQHFLEEYIERESLQAAHIYFPDPWPKKKQKKRRIVQLQLIKMLSERIVSGGHLHLRTDHADYFEQMMAVMAEQDWFEVVETPEKVSRYKTGFERRFVADGLPIFYASYRRVSVKSA